MTGMSPENSEGAGPLPVDMAGQRGAGWGVALGPSALLYWVILWVAAPVFPQGRRSCENFMTLQTDQGYVFKGEGPYLWRNIGS